MAYTEYRTVSFGSSKAGLGTVGYTLYDSAGTISGARVTAGVQALAGGQYGADVSIPDGFRGRVTWDTGEGSPAYASEEINPPAPTAAENARALLGFDSSVIPEEDNFLGIVREIYDMAGSAATAAGEAAGNAQAAATAAQGLPNANTTAAAVWDKLLADHQGEGSTGEALAGAGSGGGGGGGTLYGENGTVTYTYTLYKPDGTTPLAGASVWVSADAEGAQRSQAKLTDALGRVVFDLIEGTVYFWREAAGYTFANPDEEVVNAG